MIYTLEEMKAAWLSRRYRLPLRADCDITVTACGDGPDYDSGIVDEINDWYRNLLRHGKPEYLDPEDIKGEAITRYYPEERALEISLPSGCIRVISISLKGNPRSVTLIRSDDPRAELQQSAMSCGGYYDPIGVISDDGRLTVYGSRGDSAPELSRLMAVMETAEGVYRLNPEGFMNVQC